MKSKLTRNFILAVAANYGLIPELEFRTPLSLHYVILDDQMAIGTISWDSGIFSVVFTDGYQCNRVGYFGFDGETIYEYTHNYELITAASKLLRYCFTEGIRQLPLPSDLYARNKAP